MSSDKGRGVLAVLAFCFVAAVACSPATPANRGSALPVAEGEVVRIDADLLARTVAPGAWVVTHEKAFASNVLVVRMPDGTAVICSSPLDSGETRVMLRWLRSALEPSRIVAINTHYHPDGTAGNEAYAAEGVETFASDLTQKLLVGEGARVRDESAAVLEKAEPALAARMKATRIVPAANTFKAGEGLVFTFGGETVRVVYPGPAHSPDNVVVHFPSRGILFGGCMIKSGSTIGNTADADLAHWGEAAQSLVPLAPRIVVPGHGSLGGPDLIRNTIEVVRAARSRS